MNFLVERSQDNFETVMASYVRIESGALWFHREAMSPTRSLAVIYAPGQWLTVVQEEA